MQNVTKGRKLTMQITMNTAVLWWNMVVAVLCCGGAFLQQVTVKRIWWQQTGYKILFNCKNSHNIDANLLEKKSNFNKKVWIINFIFILFAIAQNDYFILLI